MIISSHDQRIISYHHMISMHSCQAARVGNFTAWHTKVHSKPHSHCYCGFPMFLPHGTHRFHPAGMSQNFALGAGASGVPQVHIPHRDDLDPALWMWTRLFSSSATSAVPFIVCGIVGSSPSSAGTHPLRRAFKTKCLA